VLVLLCGRRRALRQCFLSAIPFAMRKIESKRAGRRGVCPACNFAAPLAATCRCGTCRAAACLAARRACSALAPRYLAPRDCLLAISLASRDISTHSNSTLARTAPGRHHREAMVLWSSRKTRTHVFVRSSRADFSRIQAGFARAPGDHPSMPAAPAARLDLRVGTVSAATAMRRNPR